MRFQTLILTLFTFFTFFTLVSSIPVAQSTLGGTPPPASATSPKGHNYTSGTVAPGSTDACPDGTTIEHKDLSGSNGSNGSTSWKHCNGNNGNHDAHLEITTSKSTNEINGNGYSLIMKSKSKITAIGDNTTVHFKRGSSKTTFSGKGNNNQAWLNGTNHNPSWSGNNNNTGNNP